jgi:hypothetical protein
VSSSFIFLKPGQWYILGDEERILIPEKHLVVPLVDEVLQVAKVNDEPWLTHWTHYTNLYPIGMSVQACTLALVADNPMTCIKGHL